MKILFIVLLFFGCLFPGKSQTLELVPYASGFNAPVDITSAGDDRLFVVEQGGRIKIIDDNGTVLATPFLNISNLVSNGGERGLLGLAFHPDYVNNGYFFVNYTDLSGDTRVVRYSRSNTDPNLADPNSDSEVISINQTQGNHNGGGIKFGPDGYLYIGLGDGGGAGDQPNNSQNRGLLLGKMLRIDVDNGSPYSVPVDNPFVDDSNVLDEIWAIGLRNPWRFSFDRETGDLWIGDVGQNAYEEIDFQPADSPGGENYGWRCYEADNSFNQSANCGGTFTFPVYTIPHSPGGPCSITGGFVYRGSDYPSLVGKYIFADFCSRDFFTITPDELGGWIREELGTYPYSITSFGEDADGELYCAHYGGQILRVTFAACSNFSTSVEITSNACEGEANGSASLNVNGGTPPYTITPTLPLENLSAGEYEVNITDSNGCSTEESFTIAALALPNPVIMVDGNQLSVNGTFASYQWYLNDQEIGGATSATYIALDTGIYSLVVMDNNGCSATSNAVEIQMTSVTNIPELTAFGLYPNPFTEDITVSVLVTKATDFTLTIYSLNGKLVYQEAITFIGQDSHSLVLGQLPAGVYYCRLATAEGAIVKKIVKG